MEPEKSVRAFEPVALEAKWQERWEAEGIYRSDIDPERPKHYALTMLPYPSGDLHIGHWYAFTPSDARARFMRMRGYNVMFPLGFDAFGLPAENAAIKRNIHPKTWTFANIERMRGQIKRMGNMVDWRREAISAEPEYYRWTQWFFLQLLGADLGYRKKAAVDWCPSCNTTLAREQVIGDDRHCERCETPVIRKELAQWFFRTTRYAEELLRFEGIDWPERVRTLQERWIGRSEGAHVTFRTDQSDGSGEPLEIFTTRPDTLWGVTFMVLAPDHPLVARLMSQASDDRRAEVESYVEKALRQTDVQREAADKEKSGIFTGGYAINPVNGERIPVWTADYVLMGYGTGAIMAVPAHDQRDFEFARKYGLEIRPVIRPEGEPIVPVAEMKEAMSHDGVMVDSGPLTGTPADQAYEKVVAFLEEKGVGKRAVTFRLRDWLISRQRYWGAPIPIVYCPEHGAVPVPEDQLPVLLPDDVEWLPTGESPLKLHPTWRKTECPLCGGPAERETDTMDTFMCSSWYHLRYLSPHYSGGPFDPAEYRYWMPVDSYTGGIEHATMHLIYTRFFHKACRDIGIVQGDEPMLQVRNQGIVLGADSEKMSKSRGNVVAPDDLVDRYGADTMRAFLMFFARWEQGGPWNPRGIEGSARWLRRVWNLFLEPAEAAAEPAPEVVAGLRRKLHQTLRQVTADFEAFSFNTIVAALMELLNEMMALRTQGAASSPAWEEAKDVYVRMLAPVAPHIAEELWEEMGKREKHGSIHVQSWPAVDEEAARAEEITLVVQVNGKLRDRVTAPVGLGDEEMKERALATEGARRFLEGLTVRKVIVVPGRLVNIVAS
ncbi:MAG TPA: leucine--tRNA ligase [Thermoanaerobaculia bacterium]|jgi:leucyl-tRNA synthetase|nr:leucine--tRNA ligase [Thermoanaerobaculia bacterium]